MKIRKLALLGVGALMSTVIMGMAHAGECQLSPDDQTGFVITKSDGKVIDGDQCISAIVAGMNAFDKNIDQVINNKIVSSAFDTMSKDSSIIPEAKELQTTYRTERARFVNDFLKAKNLDTLPTKSNGKRHFSDAKDKVNEYMSAETPFSPEKIKDIRAKLSQQAKEYLIKKI